MAFALLVLAIRRGGVLATAMEARGFDGGERTWARPSTLGRDDVLLVVGAIVLAAAALTAAIVTGSFSLVGTGGS